MHFCCWGNNCLCTSACGKFNIFMLLPTGRTSFVYTWMWMLIPILIRCMNGSVDLVIQSINSASYCRNKDVSVVAQRCDTQPGIIIFSDWMQEGEFVRKIKIGVLARMFQIAACCWPSTLWPLRSLLKAQGHAQEHAQGRRDSQGQRRL